MLTSSKYFTMLQPMGFLFICFYSLFPSCCKSQRAEELHMCCSQCDICYYFSPQRDKLDAAVLFLSHLLSSSHWSSCKESKLTKEPVSISNVNITLGHRGIYWPLKIVLNTLGDLENSSIWHLCYSVFRYIQLMGFTQRWPNACVLTVTISSFQEKSHGNFIFLNRLTVCFICKPKAPTSTLLKIKQLQITQYPSLPHANSCVKLSGASLTQTSKLNIYIYIYMNSW